MRAQQRGAPDDRAIPISGRIVFERVYELYDALRRQNAALKARCTFLERQLAQRTQED